MNDDVETLRGLYDRFNRRDIDGVLAALTDDVVWANGMDGGHVHGHGGLRDYWTHQWSVVDPHVEPVGFETAADGSVLARVRQTVRDLDGNVVEQAHGLKDAVVGHVFRFRDGKVARFDIEGAS